MKKLLKQKIAGLALLALCLIILGICSTGHTAEDQDAAAVLILIPLGLRLFFAKNNFIDV